MLFRIAGDSDAEIGRMGVQQLIVKVFSPVHADDLVYQFAPVGVPHGSGMNSPVVLSPSPRRASTFSMPRTFRSISAFSVSSLENPPQIRCRTASTLYLFIKARSKASRAGKECVRTSREA